MTLAQPTPMTRTPSTGIAMTTALFRPLLLAGLLLGSAAHAALPSHQPLVSTFYDYDALGRLERIMDAQGYQTTFAYDANGNRIRRTDALGRITQYGYDPLNRLIRITQPDGGITELSYDGRDNLVSVKDPQGFTTQYTYNGFDDLIRQVSPDSGTTQYSQDPNGQLSSETDARNKTASYTRDDLGRVTQIGFGDETQSFTYDTAANGTGQLASFSDASGSTSYGYDPQGRLAQVTRLIGGVTLSSSQSYNPAGQLIQRTYPSGTSVSYGWSHGRISQIQVNGQLLLNNIQYSADGRVLGWTWANGQTRSQPGDGNGRVAGISLGNQSFTYHYDAVGNLTQQDPGTSAQRNYGYDSVGRLTSAAIGTTQYGYSYDLNGNRTEKRTGSAVTTHTHDPNSNRLLSVAGNLNGTYSYDAAGNVVNAGANVYNNAGRILRSKSGAVWWDYRYNALGQRVKKTDNASNTTLFVYDEQGQLLGEYDGSGQPRLDTIWLENLPVAVVQAATPAPKVYYAWADHLGTPRQLSNPADTKVVWEWAIAEPFGQSSANADPDNDGQQLVYNLRFPGQYFDAETGRYYNYFRDYDPRIGRYIQSDPIGLVGGVNTYSYSNGNSITYSDPLGLTSCNPVDFAKCQRKCSADGMMVESCETYTILPWVEQTVCACDGLCPTDSYENPGHHDASNRGPNPYNNSKSTLPQNHEELWKNSKRGSDGNRWTKIGSGKKAEYHRFQNDGNGNWHWNGSTNGRTASGVSRNINPNNIPKDVKAW